MSKKKKKEKKKKGRRRRRGGGEKKLNAWLLFSHNIMIGYNFANSMHGFFALTIL